MMIYYQKLLRIKLRVLLTSNPSSVTSVQLSLESVNIY